MTKIQGFALIPSLLVAAVTLFTSQAQAQDKKPDKSAQISDRAIVKPQTSTPDKLSIFSLERARMLAGGTSPSIEAAEAGIRSAAAGVAIAGLRPNPEIQVETENLAGSGVYRGTKSSETTAAIALPIELGGKRSARIAVAKSRNSRAQIDAAISLADLNLNISQSYIRAAAAERRVDVARQQAEIAQNAFKAASIRLKSGSGAPIDQQRADVLRINAEVGLERAIREAEVTRAHLERSIGQAIDGSLDLAWFDKVGNRAPVGPIDPSGTLALAAAEADLKTANAEVQLARSQRIPDLTVSAGARRFEESNDTAAVVGIAIPFPVFNTGTAGISQAHAEEARVSANRRMADIEAEQAIANAQEELINAAATAKSAGGPALSAASEAARIARLGYSQGKFSQLDLLEAERTLAETRSALTDALAAYHDAEARLERLTASSPELGKI